MNFMFRLPLFPVMTLDSQDFGGRQAKGIRILDIHEIAAGKLAALFARHQARDLFDTHLLLGRGELNLPLLRTAFVVYGALNRKDWRTISIKDISFDPNELDGMLLPLLRPSAMPEGSTAEFTQKLSGECSEKLKAVLPFSDKEKVFLNRVLERGDIIPSLLTEDAELQRRIKEHPMLQWKAMNVRKHFKIDQG